MTARLEENKKVLESMKQTLEFQKQVSAEKLRVVDEKYSAVKKVVVFFRVFRYDIYI